MMLPVMSCCISLKELQFCAAQKLVKSKKNTHSVADHDLSQAIIATSVSLRFSNHFPGGPVLAVLECRRSGFY